MTYQFFEYGILWQLFVSIWLFRTNSWLTPRVVFPKVSITVSDHGFKCFLGSVISSDKSECVAKFRFASVVHFFTFNLSTESIKFISKDYLFGKSELWKLKNTENIKRNCYEIACCIDLIFAIISSSVPCFFFAKMFYKGVVDCHGCHEESFQIDCGHTAWYFTFSRKRFTEFVS